MATYKFGAGSLTHELWIDNKRVFTKPTSVNVEFQAAGGFDWVFADSAGSEIRTLRHKGTGGWTSVDLPSLGLYGDYSIGFRNASAGTIQQIKQGDVTYG